LEEATIVAALPVTLRDDGVTVAVRLTPEASANRLDGLAPGEDGSTTLRARVTAAPENGKANAALIKLLAKAWKLPKTALTVSAGAKDRRKTIHVAGDPDILLPHLQHWLEAHHD
jgi:uncharacterized protein (TIGR00251 family)